MRDGPPVVGVKDAAARVRVKTDNLRLRLFGQQRRLLPLSPRDAKLAIGPRRSHVVVVSTSLPGVQTQDKLPTCE